MVLIVKIDGLLSEHSERHIEHGLMNAVLDIKYENIDGRVFVIKDSHLNVQVLRIS